MFHNSFQTYSKYGKMHHKGWNCYTPERNDWRELALLAANGRKKPHIKNPKTSNRWQRWWQPMTWFSSSSVVLKRNYFPKNCELVVSPCEATEILLWALRAQINSFFPPWSNHVSLNGANIFVAIFDKMFLSGWSCGRDCKGRAKSS